jgi:hypothetical protein
MVGEYQIDQSGKACGPRMLMIWNIPEGMVGEYQVDQCGKAVGPQDVDDSGSVSYSRL